LQHVSFGNFDLREDGFLVHPLNTGSATTDQLLGSECREDDELKSAKARWTLNHQEPPDRRVRKQGDETDTGSDAAGRGKRSNGMCPHCKALVRARAWQAAELRKAGRTIRRTGRAESIPPDWSR
jgi:hypothetical protein